MNDVKCKRCDGRGRESYDEGDGRWVTDVCYRCAGSGMVDSETAHMTDMQYVAERLARFAVDEERRARNSDPEGENWAFCAAENMMTEYDYTQARVYDRAAQFGQELMTLPYTAQLAMVEALLSTPS